MAEEVLKAFKINYATYDVYLQLPLTRWDDLPLEVVNNKILVLDPKLFGGEGLFEEHAFHKFYKWVDGANPTKMTAVERIDDCE